MYLQSAIHAILDQAKQDFLTKKTWVALVRSLNKRFKNFHEDVKIKFTSQRSTNVDMDDDDFEVIGCFEHNIFEDTKLIEVYFCTKTKELLLKEEDWEYTKYDVSATIQHEFMHYHQHAVRPDDTLQRFSTVYKDHTSIQDIIYLSNPDEIDAFSFELALELSFAKKALSEYAYSSVYRYYTETFGKDHYIVKKLLKKAYLHKDHAIWKE